MNTDSKYYLLYQRLSQVEAESLTLTIDELESYL